MLKRAKQLADRIKKTEEIHVVTHIDADGISAGAIAVDTLRKLGKEHSFECVKQLDDTVLERLRNENHELVWFTDLGSSISLHYSDLPMVITDHHACPEAANHSFHLNPHLFGLDGSYEISGAGTTYLVSRSIDTQNMVLSALAIVGACGDLQEKRWQKLTGMNETIIADGVSSDVLQVKKDIRFFGRETRPLAKLLQYASDPVLPGLSGREDSCLLFFQQLGIPLKEGDYWRRWIDLEKMERQRIISSIAHLLLTKGFGHTYAKRIIGDVYLLCNEKRGTELHDAKEFATLLNATARYGKHEVGLQVCLGDRGKWLTQAQQLLQGHRQNLVEGLQYAKEEQIQRRTFLQFFDAGDGIRDTIVGIVTNMLLHTEDVDSTLPLFGFAQTETGEVKVSARTTQDLVDKGVDLSVALKKAAAIVQGVGGGHNIAAGATIPKGTEEEFLDCVEQEIQRQFAR